MNLGLDFRDSLASLPSKLEALVVRINAVWKKQHNSDGTHGDVTVSGDLDVAGDITVNGEPITGAPGPPGPVGPTGPTGPTGPPGTLSAHAPTHKSGGSDPIKLDELAAPTDISTLNASFAAHGLLRKLPGDGSLFLNGMGGFTAPSGVAPAIHGSTHVPAGSDPIPNAAYKNINNNFVAQTIADGTQIGNSLALLRLVNLAAGVGQKNWRTINYGDGILRFELMDDANSGILASFYCRPNGTFEVAAVAASGNVQAGANVTAGGIVTAVNYIYSTGAHVVAYTDMYALNGGLFEQGRTTRAGHWLPVNHVGANFYGLAPMTWTVVAGSQYGNHYTIIGNTAMWTVYLVNVVWASISTATAAVYINLPAGLGTGIQSDGSYCEIYEPGVGWIPGSVNVEVGNSRVIIAKYNKTAYGLGTGHIRFSITFRIA